MLVITLFICFVLHELSITIIICIVCSILVIFEMKILLYVCMLAMHFHDEIGKPSVLYSKHMFVFLAFILRFNESEPPVLCLTGNACI